MTIRHVTGDTPFPGSQEIFHLHRDKIAAPADASRFPVVGKFRQIEPIAAPLASGRDGIPAGKGRELIHGQMGKFRGKARWEWASESFDGRIGGTGKGGEVIERGTGHARQEHSSQRVDPV
jgi:hypothetical protein